MHYIVFDTNVLRNEHFHSPRMKMLKRLIDEGLATVYIPEIVKREFLTQKVLEYQEKLKTKKITDVNKFFVNNNCNIKEKLSQAEKLIEEIYTDIEYLIGTEFDDWVYDYKIEILPFNNSKMTEVMDNYFTGGTVFRQMKSRQDIPDAMICTSIEELCSEVGELNVLNNDKTFSEYLNTIHGLQVFSTTQDLLEKEAIKNDLDILDKSVKKFELLHSYLQSDIFKKYLVLYLTIKSDVVNDIYLEDDNISNVSILGHYVFYCNVESVDSSTISDLEINNVELVDENEYSLYINFKAKGSLRFGTEYFEYMQLEKDEHRYIEYYNMKSDGATILDENRFLEFYGVLSINVKDIESENPEELLDYNSIDLDIDQADII